MAFIARHAANSGSADLDDDDLAVEGRLVVLPLGGCMRGFDDDTVDDHRVRLNQWRSGEWLLLTTRASSRQTGMLMSCIGEVPPSDAVLCGHVLAKDAVQWVAKGWVAASRDGARRATRVWLAAMDAGGVRRAELMGGRTSIPERESNPPFR